MAKIKIDPETVISCGNNVSEKAAEYNKLVKNIYDYVDELRATWTGSAAQRFTDNIEQFRADYKRFGELLTNVGELLTAIGKDYQALEQDL